ncbi:hypothetical protein STANM309S_00186 [Streptomyces tanashiensis]
MKVTAYARVKVSMAVSKHYKTAKIGSTSYQWFHRNTDPLLTSTMSYYPGRQQRFDLQVSYRGSWVPAGTTVGGDGHERQVARDAGAR